MSLRDAGVVETNEGDRVEDAILRRIALLWQTRVLRRESLVVDDEIETVLSYLRDVFVPVLPILYQRWDEALGGGLGARRVPTFLRLGSWVGGDRDGNPFVTADTLRSAITRAAETILQAHAEAVHTIGAQL